MCCLLEHGNFYPRIIRSHRIRPVKSTHRVSSRHVAGNPVELRPRAHEQAPAGDRRRRQRHLVELVDADDVELPTGADHISVAGLAQQEDIPVVPPR